MLRDFVPEFGPAIVGDITEQQPGGRVAGVDHERLPRDPRGVVVALDDVVAERQPVQSLRIEGIGAGVGFQFFELGRPLGGLPRQWERREQEQQRDGEPRSTHA